MLNLAGPLTAALFDQPVEELDAGRGRPEQVGVARPEHLAFEQFQAVHVAFDGPLLQGRGESGSDCVLVTAQPASERLTCWLVVGVDGGHPRLQPCFAIRAGRDLPRVGVAVQDGGSHRR